MDLKTTLILLALLAAAGVGLLFTSRGSKSTSSPGPEAKSGQENHETQLLKPDELGQKLSRIAFRDGESNIKLELRREQGRWWVHQPHRFPASGNVVQDLLATLGAMTAIPVDEPEDQGRSAGPVLVLEYGSTQARVVLTPLKRLGAGRATISAERNGTRANQTTQSTFVDLLEQLNPGVFFDKKIDPPLMPELGRIDIAITGQPSSSLVQRGDRWWIGDDKRAERALELGLKGYQSIADYFKLFELAELDMQHPYAGAKGLGVFGLDRPTIQVRYIPLDAADDRDKAGWTLRVGAATDTQPRMRYLSFGRADDPRPAVFTVNEQVAMLFGQVGASFRDPRIIANPPAKIRSVRIDQPGRNVQPLRIDFALDGKVTMSSLRGRDGEFGGMMIPADPPTALAMLAGLGKARAAAFVKPRAIPRPTARRVTVRTGQDEDTEVFDIVEDEASKPEKPTVLIRRADEPILLRIDRADVSALLDPSVLNAMN